MRAARLYTPPCRLVGWSVPFLTFLAFLSFLSLRLLPRCPSDLLQHLSAHPHATRVALYPALLRLLLLLLLLLFLLLWDDGGGCCCYCCCLSLLFVSLLSSVFVVFEMSSSSTICRPTELIYSFTSILIETISFIVQRSHLMPFVRLKTPSTNRNQCQTAPQIARLEKKKR